MSGAAAPGPSGTTTTVAVGGQAQAQEGCAPPAPAAGLSTSGVPVAEVLTLHLVPRRKKKKKAVQWAEDTVDNEFLGRKSSKQCCIFHPTRPFGEWSDEEDGGGCPDCGPPGSEGPPGSSPPPPPGAPA